MGVRVCLQFTEFIDNSLKAFKDAPKDAPKVIDIYILQEELNANGGSDDKFSAVIVRDSGIGMNFQDMERWCKRQNNPLRSTKVCWPI
jgi:hypothetical protein